MRKVLKSVLIMLTICAMCITCMTPVSVDAASTNSKAHTAYKQKMDETLKDSYFSTIKYKYKDINGDGVDELIAQNSGPDWHHYIYTYKNGEVQQISDSVYTYGISSLRIYKKTKALRVYYKGHGVEGYKYFKYSNGKYTLAAYKSRQSKKGGAAKNGKWSYSKSYSKTVKKLAKGSSTKFTLSSTRRK